MNTILLRRLLLCTQLWLANASVGAQTVIDVDRLNSWLSAVERQDMAMGSLAVQAAQGPAYLRAVGSARRDGLLPQAATPDTRYRIGSLSKLLTAVMVLQLVDEGALALDTPISRWFPSLAQAERITVEQLLSHRSGIGDIKDLPDFDRHWQFEPRSENELLKAIGSLPRAFEPNERAAYNNSGFLLLSFIVEKAGGLAYAQALERRLVQPLGLRETGFDARPGLQPGQAISYRWMGRWEAVRATDPSVPLGSGGVLSSPRDLVSVVRALFEGQLLRPATLRRMLSVRQGFGLGIYRLPGPGPEAWGHEGVIDGFSSTLAWFPQAKLALAWLGNGHQLPRERLVQTLRQAVFEPGTRLPTYAPVQARVNFVVDLAAAPGTAPPAGVGLRGDAAPLNWNQGLALTRDPVSGHWTTAVTLQLRDGLPLAYKYLINDSQWESTPNRLLVATPEHATTTRDFFNQDAARLALREQILAADERLFAAFNRRDVPGMATIFSERLEFFHDKGGLTGYAQNLRTFEASFKAGQATRRERVETDQEVFPLGDFGAFHSGSHRFCQAAQQPPSCQTYRFANVWERTPDGWRLLRVVSYDH